MASELSRIVQTMISIYGFDISKYDDAFIKQATDKRCEAIEIKKVTDYIVCISNNIAEAQNLLNALIITYSEFFRNPLTFAHLEQWILPRLIGNKPNNSEFRVWSAGCSSGQEAYSIAMLLESMYSKKQKALPYRIIATDISESALIAANKGEYTEEAIRNIRKKDLKEYFVKSGETYTACEQVKKHISFSTYDLMDNLTAYPQESIFGDFDLVFCCNVLFYYKPEFQHFILRKLINSMSEHGYLITGETERQTLEKFGGLHIVAPPSPIFQKNEV